MKPDPRLIPRLNVEFDLQDFKLAQRAQDFDEHGLVRTIGDLWPGTTATFVDSGRSALFLALKALGLGQGSRVGVPLYTCDAVFEAIVRAGCTPVFVDIDPLTLTMSPEDLAAKAHGLDAVVPIHTFGHPADMEAITRACPHARIVEDCAHAVGTRYRGQVVGALGDASFFSFRLGKPLSVGTLGMLLCGDPEVAARATGIANDFPQYSDLSRTVDSLKTLSRGALYRRPWFGLVALPVGSLVDARLDLMAKAGFTPHRPARGLLAVLSRRLARLNWRIDRAREHALVYASALEGTDIRPVGEAPWAFHTYFQFAMRFTSAGDRGRAVRRLAQRSIDSIRFYHDSPLLAAGHGYPGGCRNSELAAATVLTVPCHARLGAQDVNRIVSSLRELGGAK